MAPATKAMGVARTPELGTVVVAAVVDLVEVDEWAAYKAVSG